MFHRIRTARTAATLIALTVVGALGGPPVAAAAPSSRAPLAPCDGAPPRVTGFAEAAAPIPPEVPVPVEAVTIPVPRDLPTPDGVRLPESIEVPAEVVAQLADGLR